MQRLHSMVLGAAAAALLAACGGGGGGNPAAPTVTLQPGSDVPQSAASSISGVIAFLQSLIAGTSETSEPITIGDATLATSETAEPEPIAP